ncbi:MAG TPA: nitroreductase family protein [Phycisphaerae bacterium]|nr:nitroreductase family protein [Phycisphaerae bacterium]
MDVLEAIKMRRSVRAYANNPIPPISISRMMKALRYAPSACNYQPWHFIWVQSERMRRGIAAASGKQQWLANAPYIVVACGFPARAYPRMGGYGNSVDIDVAIAIDHLTLAAVAEGLGTCWIGAFNEAAVKQLLGIPPEAKVVAMTPIGYPAQSDLIHFIADSDRKPIKDILSVDAYGGPIEDLVYPET